ncbi:MAG: hypothetical protein U0Q11_22575 [Vicinamibacterales bacterium]
MRTPLAMLLTLGVSATALVVAAPPAAQGVRPVSSTESAWPGVRLPSGLGDPHKPILDVSAVHPAPARVPDGEPADPTLQGANIRRDLEAIVAISKADRARGEKAWGRITGFQGGDDTHAWVLEQFSKAGLREAATQTYTATQPTWYPKQWQVRLLATSKAGSHSSDVTLESAFPTSGSHLPGGPITAPLVFVGATTDAVIADADVTARSPSKRCTRKEARIQSVRRLPNAPASSRSAVPPPFSTSLNRRAICTCAISATAACPASTSVQTTADSFAT